MRSPTCCNLAATHASRWPAQGATDFTEPTTLRAHDEHAWKDLETLSLRETPSTHSNKAHAVQRFNVECLPNQPEKVSQTACMHHRYRLQDAESFQICTER